MIEYIQDEVRKQNWKKPNDKFLYMDEIVYLNRKGRDSDNLKKLQQDCITESGVVWSDDSWCLPRTQRILIDSNNPRIKLEITLAEFVGVFENERLFRVFNSVCKTCKRYKNNCSILKKAIEGRIQDEVNDDFICSKYKSIK